jgi:DNA-binding PadR family transcriptional regulator
LAECTASDLPPPLKPAGIRSLFEQRAYAELDRIGDEQRSSKQVNSEGHRQLDDYYRVLLNQCSALAGESEKALRDRLEEWKRARPDSITWRVLLAQQLVDIGWEARGGGWAYTVTPQGWATFEKYLSEAWETLKEAEQISTHDPKVFTLMMTIGMGLGKAPDEQTASRFSLITESIRRAFGGAAEPSSEAEIHDTIFNEAIKHDRLYMPLYNAYAMAVMPRWGGEPGEVEAFAQRAAELNSEFGDMYYAVVAVGMMEDHWEEGYHGEQQFFWPRVKSGLDRILEEYPNSNYFTNFAARMACAHEDREAAAAYRAKIEQPLPDRVWINANRMNTFFAWIEGSGEYPYGGLLRSAINDEDEDELRRLVEAGVDPNTIDYFGVMPILSAAQWGKLDAARVLLELGADAAKLMPSGNTPLSEACRSQEMEFVRLFLEFGTNPDAPNVKGWTPLSQCIRDDKPLSVQALLEGGADVNAKMPHGITAMHIAAESDRVEYAKMLLKRGADLHAKMDNGNTALAVARIAKSAGMIEYLESINDPADSE